MIRAGGSWDPIPANLFVGMVAGPENTCVQSKRHNGGKVVNDVPRIMYTKILDPNPGIYKNVFPENHVRPGLQKSPKKIRL